MDHIITANDSEEIEIHSKWLDWTWTLGQLFQQPEKEMVTTAIDKLRKIRCRGAPPRTKDHDQAGQGGGQGGPCQPLDLHHSRGHDLWNIGMSLPAFLLLENLPKLQPSRNSGPLPVSSSCATHHFQHDHRSDSKMKTKNIIEDHFYPILYS
jgi:hypothetical protein